MNGVAAHLWLIPLLPLLAAGVSALLRAPHRRLAAGLSVGTMAVALGFSCAAFLSVIHQTPGAEPVRQVFNFRWFQVGDGWVELGWLLDPLTAVMLVMVSFVGLLIFIYSIGYMAHDENFTRFFCFLSLFAAAMLGLVIANSLLLFFICWELVGLTSYLLIGFWYQKPSASAAAKKAFITTRLGDLAFLLGLVWLYSQTGTVLFYSNGAGTGCLEPANLTLLATSFTPHGFAVSTCIALLLFCGAIGKSGQVPLHVWLPDAMEGPTPVSALIHAATMVAAGVFLVARVYPLFSVTVSNALAPSAALSVVTWVGAVTAVFAATIAVAQTDIKRILAYSTISQLGYMMLGLGVGGVAVGMFHLITHAFFKALLFLGAGSVIHGCHEEQDVRCLGGLRRFMPLTFATYAIGMLALCGFPLFFSGFWSKDEILHAARGLYFTRTPFYLGVAGALLTAFYMTRQMYFVFFGNCRLSLGKTTFSEQQTVAHAGVSPQEHPHDELPRTPHESPGLMTVPLAILAVFSVVLGWIGTPAWPWFQTFLDGGHSEFSLRRLLENGVPTVMALSTAMVFLGLFLGWWFYGRTPLSSPQENDALAKLWPNVFTLLRRKYYIDEVYEWTVVGFNAWWSKACDGLDRWLWGGLVQLLQVFTLGLSWLDRFFDEFAINTGFDEICRKLTGGGGQVSRLQNGQVQRYLRILGLAFAILTILFLWGCHAA